MTHVATDTIDVWWLRCDRVSDAYVDRWWRLLSEDERRRADRFVFGDNRREFVAAHSLARLMLAELTGIEPSTLRFATSARGKPSLVDNATEFSLTHAGGVVACAASTNGAVGIDAESIHPRPRFDAERLARSTFDPAEVDLVRQGGYPTFVQLWTLKEALLKATGTGLTEPLRDVRFALDPIRLLRGDAACWHFAQFRPDPDHVIAVAGRRERPGQTHVEARVVDPNEVPR